jgi:hypothetical protein
MRLKRRGLIHGYIKVPEQSKNGKQHLHIIFRGSYIEQAWISAMWQEIHKAKVVDIRRVNKGRTKAQLAGYMAKYMSKENAFRYSWSWDWVWRGFVKDWQKLKKVTGPYCEASGRGYYRTLLKFWRWLVIKGREDGWALLEELTVISERG